jgi:hypothetical protein
VPVPEVTEVSEPLVDPVPEPVPAPGAVVPVDEPDAFKVSLFPCTPLLDVPLLPAFSLMVKESVVEVELSSALLLQEPKAKAIKANTITLFISYPFCLK